MTFINESQIESELGGRGGPTDPPDNSKQRPEPAPIVALKDLLGPALERARKRAAKEEQPVPLLFDEHATIMRGGLWPGVHACVAGTGVGKSTFWFQNARYAAHHGVPVLYIGLELNRDQVALRMLGEQAGVSWSKLYTGTATAEEIDGVRAVRDELAALPFYLEFGAPNGWPASRLLERARQIRERHPHDLGRPFSATYGSAPWPA